MTDKQLWKEMDALAKRAPSLGREMEFMLLLKKAYEKDLKLIMSCVYIPGMPGMAQQGYLDVEGKRMLVCYTSKTHAEKEFRGGSWDIAKARDLMNNMFHKPVIAGMVFNPEDRNMVIILKDLLEPLIPGDKPKPPFFRQ